MSRRPQRDLRASLHCEAVLVTRSDEAHDACRHAMLIRFMCRPMR